MYVQTRLDDKHVDFIVRFLVVFSFCLFMGLC